jgi:hypothetical protein
MTLLEWSSPWDNSTNTSSKKKTPTMNPPPRSEEPFTPQKNTVQDSSEDYLRHQNASPYLETMDGNTEERPIALNSIKSSQLANEQRNKNINKLIEKMTAIQTNNDGSGLIDFNPPPRPEINHRTNPTDLLPTTPPTDKNVQKTNYAPTSSPVFNKENFLDNGNYKKMYEPPTLVNPSAGYVPYYAKSQMLDSNKYDEQLLKKINYMIHLLEEQKKEKTDNVTEEFILYSFLGIFIIYIVDTFTRSGKYTR